MEILFLCINTSDLYVKFLRRVRDNIVRIMPSWKITIENINRHEIGFLPSKSGCDPFVLQTILNDGEYDKIVLFLDFDVFAQDFIAVVDRFGTVLTLIQSQIDTIHEFYGEEKLPIYVAESIRLGGSEKDGFNIMRHPYLGEFNDKLQHQFSYIPLNVGNLNPDSEPCNESAEIYQKYFKKDNRVYLPAINLLFYLGN